MVGLCRTSWRVAMRPVSFVLLLCYCAALAMPSAAAARTSPHHARRKHAAPAPAPTPAPTPAPAPAAAPLMPGQPAPDFTLTDTDGKSWHLADLTAAGKTVVLEWFSPTCPVCKAYYEQPADGSASRMEKIIASV